MQGGISKVSRRARIQALALLALIAVLARLPVLLVAHGADFDMESFARVSSLMRAGGNLYGDPSLAHRYPYLPAWALLLWGLSWIASLAGGAPPWIFKLPAFFADLGVTALIYLIALRLASPASRSSSNPGPPWSDRAFWAAAAWAASPISILISAGHGQFDSLALLFILLAAWYLEFSEEPLSDFAGALSLGFAIAFKTWPIFFLPLFLRSLPSAKERLAYAAVSLGLPLLLLLPFVAMCSLHDTVASLSYSGSQALSLPEALRGFFFGSGASAQNYREAARALGGANLLILALAWIAYALGPWHFPLFAGLAFATLTLYVFAPGLAAQYLCWLLPFALLIPGRLALRHSLASLLALLLFYGLFAPEAFLSLGAWQGAAAPQAAGFFMVWAFLNLALWLFFVREWISLGRLCLRPSGRLGFE